MREALKQDGVAQGIYCKPGKKGDLDMMKRTH